MSGLEEELKALMLDQVTIEPQTGIDGHGDFTYGTPRTVYCQIYKMQRRVFDNQGRETVSTVQVILAEPIAVKGEDRLTLPDGSQPPIKEILAANDDVGEYYVEVRA